jgi:hypothetical protein
VLVLAAVALVVVAAVAGGLLLFNKESGVRFSDLQPGDCFQRPSGSFTHLDVVDCAGQHDLEVYAVVVHPGPPGEAFPGQDALGRYANPLCLQQFRGYAGVGFEQLNLNDVYITPQERSWRNGERTLVCAVGTADGSPSEGSIRATA